MAGSLNTPDVLTQPIAANGDKNTIPTTNDQSLGLMSQATGFPAICSERIADGGKAPRRADFNGAFNLVSQHHFFLQNGGTETFRQSVSDAIGGYPLGARLWYVNQAGESVIVRSLIQNNTYNFNTDPSYIDGQKWVVDVQSGAPAGSLMSYPGTTAPEGFLLCDGAEVSRTTYARLFAAIGTTYGAGDGSTTFNLPDFSHSHLVVEFQAPTAENNYKWHRKYSDGWVEQGGYLASTGSWGITTVVLPVEMLDAKYTLTLAGNTVASGDFTSGTSATIRGETRGLVWNRTSKGFGCQSNNIVTWRVCGMVASSQQTRYIIKY